MSVLLPVATRCLSLAVAVTAYLLFAVRGWGEKGDANIGAGLLAFALVIAVSFVWSVRDGHRLGAGRAIAVWLAVGVLTAAVWIGFLAVSESLPLSQVLSDAAVLGPMLFGMVAGPAAIGAALGHTMSQAAHPGQAR